MAYWRGFVSWVAGVAAFLQAGSGAVYRTLQDKLRDTVSVKDFGAVGDGTTDDTAAIQAALDTGKHVFVPGVSSYYKLTSAVTGSDYQRLFGEGEKSQLRQTTANANVISATSKTGFVVENLKVYAVGSWTAYNTGAGVLLTSCSRSAVRNCVVENHRGGGVTLYNSNDCTVEGNWFLNSPTVAGALDSTMFADVAVVYASSRNKVRGNFCHSGQGTGILVQSVSDGDIADDNQIIGNSTLSTKTYGICAYRNDDAAPITQYVRRTVISGNVVNGVSGDVVSTALGTYTYGAGIYLQGAEDAIVSNNNVRNTHSAAQTFATTLAPGGIGVTNLMRAVISDNIVDTCGMYGIDVAEANDLGVSIGLTIVKGNQVSNTTKEGISIRQRGRIMVDGNAVDTTGLSGIRVNNSSAEVDISITNNKVRNTTGTGNIEVNYADGITIVGNSTDTSSTHGIVISNSNGGVIDANTIKSHTSRGIQVASTCSKITVGGQTVIGTGASSEGIRLDALCQITGTSDISGCTTRWAGNFAVLRGTQSGTAVGNVGVGEDDLGTYVIPAAALSVAGDTVRVVGWGLTANNANAKTLKAYLGTTLILTTSLTTSQAGVWRVEIEIIRTGSNAQRCMAQLIQGGTTTLSDVEYTTAAETESAAITVKLTGEATANNDIQQLGMIGSFLKG